MAIMQTIGTDLRRAFACAVRFCNMHCRATRAAVSDAGLRASVLAWPMSRVLTACRERRASAQTPLLVSILEASITLNIYEQTIAFVRRFFQRLSNHSKRQSFRSPIFASVILSVQEASCGFDDCPGHLGRFSRNPPLIHTETTFG
jgi:hypothetical protein